MRGEISRRQCLHIGSTAFGSLAWAALQGHAQVARGMARAPDGARLAPRAKRVIFLFMNGGPSQRDLFDPKPEVARRHGQPLPFQMPDLVRTRTKNLYATSFSFRKHGQSGIAVSELLPQLANCVDDICVIRSMQNGNQVSHGPAALALHTGDGVFTRASMGAWLLYGLGSENQNLPGFVTLSPSSYHGG